MSALDAAAYGPQGAHIVALVEKKATLGPREGSWLDISGAGSLYDDARDAARDAAYAADRMEEWDAARGLIWQAGRLAVSALVVRDLIGQHGFTQEHYDHLTHPWRRYVGPVHPDDEVATRLADEREPTEDELTESSRAAMLEQEAERARDGLVDRLEEVSGRVRAAEAALARVQQERHEVWREALDAGMTAYRIAAVCGVTQRAVHKVREIP